MILHVNMKFERLMIVGLFLLSFALITEAISDDFIPLYLKKHTAPSKENNVIETTYIQPTLQFNESIEGHTLGTLYRGKREALMYCLKMNHEGLKHRGMIGAEVRRAAYHKVLMVEVNRKGKVIPALVSSDIIKSGYINPYALVEVTCVN